MKIEVAKVLVVDDSLVNLKVAEQIVKSAGHQAETCTSGQEAIGLLTKNKYDLVLLDCLMPGLNGYQTAQLIRMQSASKNVPIIALSALFDDAHWYECIKAGMSDVLPKPLQKNDLIIKLAKFCRIGNIGPEENRGTEVLKILPIVDEVLLKGLAQGLSVDGLNQLIDSSSKASHALTHEVCRFIETRDFDEVMNRSLSLMDLVRSVGSVRFLALLEYMISNKERFEEYSPDFWADEILRQRSTLSAHLLKNWHSKTRV